MPCSLFLAHATSWFISAPAKANPIRGLLGEVGIAVGKGIAVATERAGGVLQQRSLPLWDLIRMNVKSLS
jgi:hypothetical protein